MSKLTKIEIEEALEDTRSIFEEEVFKEYFLRSIKKNPVTGWLTSSPDLKTKAEFLKRDEDGDYAEETLDAMWFGWKLASENTLKGLAEAMNVKVE